MSSTSPFKPAWWLNNDHLQTIYPALLRRPEKSPVRRERLPTPDQDFLDLDFCDAVDGPLVLLLHGLTGGSASVYILGLQSALLRKGYSSVALNFRGCSGVQNNTSRCYHSGETTDFDFVYQTLRRRYPAKPMAAVGFSLGGNVLLKWLGEQGDAAGLFAAVSVSVPLLLDKCATRLDKGLSRLYRAVLLAELKTYVREKQRHLLAIGNVKAAETVADLGDLSGIHSFWEYDERVVARLYGFDGAADYYRRSSSRHFLKLIRTPTLMVQAADDPFMTADVLPAVDELPECVRLEVTENGGHVGFIAGNNPLKPVYWLEDRILSFLAANPG